MLLTLLAVPVFYSLFDDLAESPIFTRIGQFFGNLFGGLRRRLIGATASLFGIK